MTIRRARLRAGLSQRELARRLGLASSTVSRWEQGGTQPGARMLRPLSEALDIPLETLLHEFTAYDEE